MDGGSYQTIVDDVTPLASRANGTWALANIFLVVLVVTLCVGEVMTFANSNKDRPLTSRILSIVTIVPAVFAAVFCLVTQDFLAGDMVNADMTTAVLAGTAVLQIVFVIAAHQGNRLRWRSA